MRVKKTILITGGAGFIGSHLCERLVNSGHRVICVDNLYSGSSKNISRLLESSNFSFSKKNIIEPLEFNEEIDEMWNLASPASPVWYQREPIFTATTNFIGTKNLLDFAVKHRAKFLQASTSEVYGNPLEHPQKESYWGNVNFTGVRSCYDEGKRIAETLCFDYHRKYNLDIKVVRIFNTYGPQMQLNDGRAISNFIVQALKGEDITIYGNGMQTRSFCYVDDLIEGMIKMMRQRDNGPVNLGNPQEQTIKEIAETIKKITNSGSKIVYKPLPEDDPIRRCPDITKARKLLDWEPQISLEQGFKKTIKYFRNILGRRSNTK